MTPHEMHLAILKELGWTQTAKGWWINPEDTNGGDAEPPPLDLELMMQLERAVILEAEALYRAYNDELWRISERDRITVWHLSAEQRAEGYCRVRGLWKEDQPNALSSNKG